MIETIKMLLAEIPHMKLAEQIRVTNEIKQALHDVSPFSHEPDMEK